MNVWDQLRRDEGGGQRHLYYLNGIPHIGVGHNLAARPLSERVVDLIYEEDGADTLAGLDARLPWWRTLSERRQAVLINMAFQMGVDGLLGFHGMLAAVQAGDWALAEVEMLDSEWARRQTPARASRLASQMVTDEWTVSQ